MNIQSECRSSLGPQDSLGTFSVNLDPSTATPILSPGNFVAATMCGPVLLLIERVSERASQ